MGDLSPSKRMRPAVSFQRMRQMASQPSGTGSHASVIAESQRVTPSAAVGVFEEPAYDERWEMPEDSQDESASRFVLTEGSAGRAIWEIIVGVLLMYTGTLFLFRMCFVDFRIPQALPVDGLDPWVYIDGTMQAFFWVDLFLNFFISFRDHRGVEVTNLRRIAMHYVSGYFFLNVFACVPEAVVDVLESSGCLQDSGSLEQASGLGRSRLLRLVLISRLMRMPRLFRRLMQMAGLEQSEQLEQLEHARSIRVLTRGVGLLWIVHLLACGWYLNAALHADPDRTWVARRIVDPDGTTLLSRGPADQWAHAFYFILVVFTTVGFGDISAVTEGEIAYVCFTMVVGTVVHSIIISEVINIVTSADKVHAFITKQHETVFAFAQHTQLDNTSLRLLSAWIRFSAKGWMSTRYERDEMKALIMDKCMPRPLLGRLPANLFGGALLRNSFVAIRGGPREMPPRLPVLLALGVSRSHFDVGDIVYQKRDLAHNVFLVVSGTFADVGRPTPSGGIDDGPQLTPSDSVRVEVQESTQNLAAKSPAGSRIFAGRTGTKTTQFVRQSTMEVMQDKPVSTNLYPYKFYGANSYFGLVEVLGNTPERMSTVRCESDHGGTVLVLSKTDLLLLMQEFPHFAVAWKSETRRRERHRLQLKARLTVGLTMRSLAVNRIQKALRGRRRQKAAPMGMMAGLGHIAELVPVLREQEDIEVSPAADSCEGNAASVPVVGNAVSAVELRDIRRLVSLSEAQSREIRDLRACMDAMRSDFAVFQSDVRTMLGGAKGSERPPAVSLQTAAYSGGSTVGEACI